MRTIFSYAHLLLLFGLISTTALQAEGQETFSIYCTSNLDGTGKCRKEDGDDVLNCVMIPGGIIACKDNKKKKYECVQYGSITANQTQFFCEPDADNSVNDELFERSDLESPTPKDSSQETPATLDSGPKAPPAQQPEAVTPAKPVLLNPFQTTPKPVINDNEFQESF